MSMSEADMEQYAQLLDEMAEKDPQAYEQFMQMMKEQVEKAVADGAPIGGAPLGAANGSGSGFSGPSDVASMMEMVKNAASGKANGAVETNSQDQAFKPQFPGNKVMESDGLTPKQEGVYIEVEPGFVMKTTDLKKKQKVFVNVCHSSAIQTFSQRKQLDDQGNEQEGIHVPLSLGAPHEVEDKSGNKSIAFDVAVNTQVVEDCKTDKSGSFRNFVCELAIEYIDQKYKIQLDPRYKLPKLTYRGQLPPPKHYIRKAQKPIIEEVSKPVSSKKLTEAKKDTKREPTAVMQHEIYELTGGDGARVKCTRVASVEANGTALSKEMLQRAGSHLAIRIEFETPVTDPNEIELELRAEQLSVKADDHHDVAFYLPFPVARDDGAVSLDLSKNTLEVVVPIDKTWSETEPDAGSTPWMLVQALRGEDDEAKSQETKTSVAEAPKSLVDMFHLAMPSDKNTTGGGLATDSATGSRRTQWDPVDEDEELPEDRFHRKDMMSMHILEQRKQEKHQKAQEAEEKRKIKRAEVEEKARKAQEAGKSWQEMYPNEPETTYIDMEDIIKQEKQKRSDKQTQPEPETDAKVLLATETAQQVAAAWSEEKKTHGLDLQSALAFDLLD